MTSRFWFLSCSGRTWEDVFRYCGSQFSLKTTLMLVDQLLRRFETLHSNHYLHRDVKPENFLLGMGQPGNIVYMTVLGLAIYRHPDRWGSRVLLLVLIQYARTSSSIVRHMQIYEHQRAFGYWWVTRQLFSRVLEGQLTLLAAQYDLEALGYMLVYFIRGRLPWQGLKAKLDAKYLLVLEKKQATSASELCVGLPTEFVDYMNYVHDLRDEDQPDYQHLRKMFGRLFRRQR
ncbi:hypothetical protein LTR41_011751 [Exophiala xenobiotica]|nr:hypothetical protein LTR41_011751 [Exophiala xenobiotica]KAK5550540.1 hypothetical protein LTR46_011458 [Exophiala xenobiotica]